MPELLPSAKINTSAAVPVPGCFNASSSSSSHRGKPMVVDISIDSAGAQTFKVHDSRASRKRKRYSIDDEDDEKRTSVGVRNPQNITPNRSILRSISPISMNKGKKDGSPPPNKYPRRFDDDVSDDNIWSDDVEKAFEEALNMIPKNGLTKIKISGKSCGRNELISDYILQTTGKFRTRKQVSSHIQVIKNLKKNDSLIELINNGPTDKDSLTKFDVVFSEIQFKKSLRTAGINSIGANIQRIATPTSLGKPRARRISPVSSRPKNPLKFVKPTKPIECQLRTFEMTLVDANNSKKCTHSFSKLFDNKLGQDLRLKPNASISHRFPMLSEYSKKRADRESKRMTDVADKDTNQPPILHNLVQLDIPPHLNLSKTKPFTDLKIFMKNIAMCDSDEEQEDNEEEEEFSCLTTVYSFGNEFIKMVEEGLEIEQRLENNYFPNELQNVILKLPFAQEFWTAFLSSLSQSASTESQRTIAVKSTTIEQIIYRKGSKPSEFNKSDIKAMILWEFNINEVRQEPAETTTRKLFLPNLTSSTSVTDSILEKSVEPVKTTSSSDDNIIKTEEDEAANIGSDSGTFDLRNHQSPQFQVQPKTPSSMHENMVQVRLASDLHQDPVSSPSFQPPPRNNSVPFFFGVQHPQPQYVKRTQSEVAVWNHYQVPHQPAYNLQFQHPQTTSQQHHSQQHFSGYNSDEFTSFQHQQQQPFQEQIVTVNDSFNSTSSSSVFNNNGPLDMMHQLTDVNLHSFPTW